MEQARKIKYIIECKDLSKVFYSSTGEKFKVVDSIDLKIPENEFVVLFGPGQCGKTTIINLIAGLEPASSGSILVDGVPVTEPGPDRGVV